MQGAWLLTGMVLPWSNPPILAAAVIFGSAFANFVSGYWRRRVPEQVTETLRFQLILGVAGGLAFTVLFLSTFPRGLASLALLVGAIGGTAFALLRAWMFK